MIADFGQRQNHWWWLLLTIFQLMYIKPAKGIKPTIKLPQIIWSEITNLYLWSQLAF